MTMALLLKRPTTARGRGRTDIQELAEEVHLTEGALENFDRDLAYCGYMAASARRDSERRSSGPSISR